MKGLILTVSIITSIAVQGISIGLLHGPYYEPPIKSLKELIEMDYPIKLYPTFAYFFMHGSKHFDYYSDIYDRYKPVNSPDMFGAGDLVLEEKNFATVITKDFLTIRPNLQKSFSAFEFFSNSDRVGMPKNYYMTKEFFQLFTQMVEHGITTKFLKLYEFLYSLEFYVEHSVRVYKITMRHMAPVAIIALGGYFFASIIFLMEHFIYRLRRFSQRRTIRQVTKVTHQNL